MSDFTDYAHWRFASDGNGTNGSHRGDGSKPVPVVTPKPVRAYCPTRLAKAAVRPSVRTGPNQFRVKGNDRPYYDVNLDLDVPCDCEDAFWHGRGCLHELRARLHNGDTALLVELGMALQRAQERQEKQSNA